MTYEVDGRIARITLNRPERGNGITLDDAASSSPRASSARTSTRTVHVIALAGQRQGFLRRLRSRRRAPSSMDGRRVGGRSPRARRSIRRSSRATTIRRDLGPDGRLPDDEPQRARLHEPVPQRQAGRLQGARLLRRRRHRHGAVLGPARDRGRREDRLSAGARVGRADDGAVGRIASGSRRRSACCSPATASRGTEAVEWGLATECGAARPSSTRASRSLLERIARHADQPARDDKLLLNQTLLRAGPRADADARHRVRRHRAPHRRRATRSQRRAAGGGFKEAVRERDEPFGDFGLAGSGEPHT